MNENVVVLTESAKVSIMLFTLALTLGIFVEFIPALYKNRWRNHFCITLFMTFLYLIFKVEW